MLGCREVGPWKPRGHIPTHINLATPHSATGGSSNCIPQDAIKRFIPTDNAGMLSPAGMETVARSGVLLRDIARWWRRMPALCSELLPECVGTGYCRGASEESSKIQHLPAITAPGHQQDQAHKHTWRSFAIYWSQKSPCPGAKLQYLRKLPSLSIPSDSCPLVCPLSVQRADPLQTPQHAGAWPPCSRPVSIQQETLVFCYLASP